MSNVYDIVEYDADDEFVNQHYNGKSFEDDLGKAKAFARKVFPTASKRANTDGIKNFSLAVVNERDGYVYLRLK